MPLIRPWQRKRRCPHEPSDLRLVLGKVTELANMSNTPNGGKSLEPWIWDAACSIRGARDAPKYKEYILPLIFTKRLCDVFDDEINRIVKEVGLRAVAT